MRIAHFKRKILLLLTLSLAVTVCSQNNELRPYTMEDGLPQSQVYDLVQDTIGYLWLGTQGGGLARFDGESFTTYNDRDGLASNYIYSLKYAKDSLFIGTKRGLSIKVEERFVNYSTPQINNIVQHNGVTFLATNRGLYRFRKNEKPTKVKLNSTLDSGQLNAIVFDGKWWWIASSKGLWKVNALQDQPKTKPYSNSNFTALAFHHQQLYAATFTEGITVIDPTGIKEDQLITGETRINHLRVINEQLWVSTDARGITVYNLSSLQVTKKLTKRNGLSVSHVRRAMMDRQGNIWIATSGGGLYKYFQNEFTHYDRDTGLKGNRIYAVHANAEELWISNSEAGLAQIDSLGIHPIAPIENFSEVKIKTITTDANGNIWAGSDGKGILFRETVRRDTIIAYGDDLADLRMEQISETTNYIINEDIGLPNNWIRKLYIDKDIIWAATYSSGIVKLQYNKNSNRITILKTFAFEDGLDDVLIRDMKPDKDGKIWYSTQTGHLGYIDEGQVIHLGEILDQKTPINTILFHNSTIFLGTAGNGIWHAPMNDFKEFKKLIGAKRLTSNNSYQLIFDTEENLWMGTERGVDKIVLNQDQEIVDVFHFGRNDGFLGIETCLNAVDRDSEGNLWFGAIYGLTKYDVKRTTEASVIKPHLHFEKIEVGYKSIDEIPSNNSYAQNRGLRLTSDQTQISFVYRTIDLDHPKEVEYRYKLNETDWSPWSNSNQQNLVGLAYGPHLFTAQSRDYRWIESEPISFQFFIESPLHEKAWFQWLIIGLGLGIILLITWYYIKKYKRKNREERARLEVQNHLLSLEQKALRLQMNPHFIFNVLNGIKAMGSSNPEKMNHTINSFATMLREILYNSRKEHISLAQEMKTLKNYIEVEQLMAPTSFEYLLDVKSDIDAEEILIPPMLIQPFVENAIRHGILKGPREGKLNIQFSTDEDFLYCSITDNGPGIFESQKAKTATDHQSMALTVTRERIESISGKDALRIKEIITNKVVEGTEITFKIPLETDY